MKSINELPNKKHLNCRECKGVGEFIEDYADHRGEHQQVVTKCLKCKGTGLNSGLIQKGERRGKATEFTSERMKGNQFSKGNPPNKTTFKKGVTAMENHPSWNGGIHHMKKDCVWINLGGGKRVRRPHLVWQSVYGELPAGYIIVHKDGDRYNDDIDNLEAITRAENMLRNSRTAHGNN